MKATRFETLLEAVRDALVGMDQKGVIRFVNRQTELLFGYDRDDLIGEHIDRLVPEALWQIYASHQENYFADPRTRSSGLDLELSGRHQNGVEFPVNVSLSHIDTGDVLLVITGADDVAKQKDAVKNAELITAIVEHSLDAIIATTREGVITSWNPAAERMYGYSGREIVGRSIKLLIPEDRPGEFSAVLDRANRGEPIEPRVTIRVRKDGSPIPVSVSVAPLRDEKGRVIGTSAVHRDVTEQRRAFEVTQRMEAIVQSSDDAIIGRTLEGIVTTWNPAAERMYGYTSQEIIGQPIAPLIPEDRRAEADAVIARIRAGERVEHCESIRVRRDGTRFPASLTISPIHDPDGEIVGVSSIHRDVTQERNAFEVAQYMKAIVESSDDAVISRTVEGMITSWNPAAERMYGYTSAEMIGQSIDRLVPEHGMAETRTILNKIKQGQPVERLETMRVRKDGTLIPVSVTVSPIRDPDGKIVGASGIHRDVTEQRRALTVAQDMKAIVENSDDAIIGRTLEGTIMCWNPAAERLYGYTSDEIIGTPFNRLVPQDRLSEISEAVARIRMGHHVERLETFRVRKDGTLVPVSSTLSPIRGEDGAIVGISAIHRDMTEQVAAAKELATTSWRYRLLAENASDVVVLTNPDREVTWMSSSMTGELGWAPEDLLGTRLADLLHPDDLAATAAPRDELYSGREISAPVGGFVVRLRTKSGDYRWMSTMGTPVADESGAFAGLVSGWRDVDDLVRTREAAKAAEAALRATMDSLMDPLVLLEAVRDQTGQIVDFVYVDANPAACADNRIDQDLIGARLLDRHPGIVGAGLDRCRLVVETGEPLVLDDSVYAQEVLGGQERRYDIRAARVGDGLSLTWRDVTQQKEAFEAAQQMAAIIKSSDDAIIGQSLEGIITSWNPAAERIYGYSREEMIGQPISALMPPDRHNEMHDNLARIKAGQRVERLQTIRVRKDGTRIPISLTLSPIHSPGGEISGVSGIGRDLSEKELAAQYSRSLIEVDQDPLITISVEGKITDVNEATVTITGVRRDKLIGSDYWQYVTEPDKAIDFIQDVLTRGVLADLPLTVRHQDGTLTHVLCSASVFRDFNGDVLGVVATVRDVTKTQ